MLDRTTDRRFGDWTEERTELLKSLWAEGVSCSRIAEQMGGLSRNAVIGKVSRLGLPGRITLDAKVRRYRSGPASYEEKQRREAERLARKMVSRADRKRRKIVQPPLHIPEAPPPQEFLALTFGELEADNCRYPRGENQDMRFCGQPKMPGSSYCPHCHSITHHKPHDTTPAARNHWLTYLARRAA